VLAGVRKVEPDTAVEGVDGADPEPPTPAEYEIEKLRFVVAAARADSVPLIVDVPLPIDVAVTQYCVLATSPVKV
jgi:hypothetical protein